MSFYTDVILKSPARLSSDLNRDPALIEPETLRRARAVIADAEIKGITLAIFEGYRSPARQELLFQQKRTQLQKVGCHGYGLAVDLVKQLPATRERRIVHWVQRTFGGYHPAHGSLVVGMPTMLWSWGGDYTFLGKLYRLHELCWGGNWPGLVDMVHGQRCSVADQSRLFAGTFYPDVGYDPGP